MADTLGSGVALATTPLPKKGQGASRKLHAQGPLMAALIIENKTTAYSICAAGWLHHHCADLFYYFFGYYQYLCQEKADNASAIIILVL